MQMPQIDAHALAQAGREALHKGNAQHARALFEQIVAAGRADVTVFIGLASACRQLEDNEAKLAAIDKALALEPRNLRALIMKGDHFAEAGDTRAAGSFYKAAIMSAPPANQLPPDVLKEVQRAQAMRQRYAEQYEAHLHDRLIARGFKAGQSSQRFAQSLDLLLGKKQVFLQEPLHYYFPELPQIQFYNRKNFPWLDAVEAATADIRAELVEVLKGDDAFSPYIESSPDRWFDDHHGMLNNPNWSAFYLWKNGMIVQENAARCPKTMNALKEAPLTRIKNRAPSIMFSLLRPGAHIPPHTGFINVRLICHLPLIVPEKCSFRVGNDVRSWVEGRAWVFDDTIQHEAWNRSDKLRVILLFDIWRPELSEEERALVASLFEAIDAYGDGQPEWDA